MRTVNNVKFSNDLQAEDCYKKTCDKTNVGKDKKSDLKQNQLSHTLKISTN